MIEYCFHAHEAGQPTDECVWIVDAEGTTTYLIVCVECLEFAQEFMTEMEALVGSN